MLISLLHARKTNKFWLHICNIYNIYCFMKNQNRNDERDS